MNARIRTGVVLLATLLCTQLARAELIVDGGFETPVLAVGTATTFTPGQTIGAWTVVGDAGTNVALGETTYSEPFNNVSQFNAQEGFNSLDVSGSFNQGSSAGVEQIVSTTAGQQYLLSFYVGRVTPNSGPGGVYSTAATVDLSIDSGPRLGFTNADVTNGMVNWKQFNTTFTASGASTTITFLNGTSTNNMAGLDNVSMVAVPEPTSLALLVLGGLLAGPFSRRRRPRKS